MKKAKKEIRLDAQSLLGTSEMIKLKGGVLASLDPCACKSGCRSACINGGQIQT